MRAMLIFGLWLSVTAAGHAEDTENARLAFLLQQADDLTISATDSEGAAVEATRRAEPLLKFTNPLHAEQADGALLMWVDGELPVLMASYSIRSEKEVFRELSLVSPLSIQADRRGQLVWSPDGTSFQQQTFPGAPDPAANERLRLVQMRGLVRRFQVGSMRVMPTPLYRYSSSEHGVQDGALFAFTDTNDPELIVSVTAVTRGDEPAHWEYGLCRMNSASMTVLLDNQTVWSVEGYWDGERTPKLPYVEQRDASLPEELRLSGEK